MAEVASPSNPELGPLVVGIGGSTRGDSSTSVVLRAALSALAAGGARTQVFDGAYLAGLPIFGANGSDGVHAVALVDAVRAADAVVIATPGYHGGLSGLVKNGLDHLEALRDDDRPYLDGRCVGTIVTAAGWQACGTTLVSLRSTVHALRGWPTPFGIAMNTAEDAVGPAGELPPRVAGAIDILAGQIGFFVGGRR